MYRFLCLHALRCPTQKCFCRGFRKPPVRRYVRDCRARYDKTDDLPCCRNDRAHVFLPGDCCNYKPVRTIHSADSGDGDAIPVPNIRVPSILPNSLHTNMGNTTENTKSFPSRNSSQSRRIRIPSADRKRPSSIASPTTSGWHRWGIHTHTNRRRTHSSPTTDTLPIPLPNTADCSPEWHNADCGNAQCAWHIHNRLSIPRIRSPIRPVRRKTSLLYRAYHFPPQKYSHGKNTGDCTHPHPLLFQLRLSPLPWERLYQTQSRHPLFALFSPPLSVPLSCSSSEQSTSRHCSAP